MISFLFCIKELRILYIFSKSIQRTHAHFLKGHSVILLYMYTCCSKLHVQNCPKECRQHWMGVIWRVQARTPLCLAALLAAPLRGSVWCIVVCSMYFSPVVCFWQIILWSTSDSSLKAVSFSCCHFQWFHIVHCNKFMQLLNVMFVICICFCSWTCVWAFSALLNSHFKFGSLTGGWCIVMHFDPVAKNFMHFFKKNSALCLYLNTFHSKSFFSHSTFLWPVVWTWICVFFNQMFNFLRSLLLSFAIWTYLQTPRFLWWGSNIECIH